MKLKVSVSTQLLCILTLWSTQVLAIGGLLDQPSAVTYLTPAGDRQIWVFAPINFSRRLWADMWSGEWTWMDLGLPAPGEQVFWPSAISYPDASGAQAIRVFAQTADGRLILDALDADSGWQWSDLGRPGSVRVFQPMAITYLDAAGFQQVRVFMEASDGHLWVDAWEGGPWEWVDLGLPDREERVAEPSAVFYRDGSGVVHVQAFASESNGHLVVWDNERRWSDLGLPPGASRVWSPSAVAFVDDEGNAQTRVFALADNLEGTAHLVMNDWSDSVSRWVDIGLPDGVNVIASPAAITFDIVGIQFISVFVEASFGHLFAAEWDSLVPEWTWYDLGQGPGGGRARNPTPISFVDDSGVVQTRVYAEGEFGQLVEDAWDGTSWTWSDLGPR